MSSAISPVAIGTIPVYGSFQNGWLRTTDRVPERAWTSQQSKHTAAPVSGNKAV